MKIKKKKLQSQFDTLFIHSLLHQFCVEFQFSADTNFLSLLNTANKARRRNKDLHSLEWKAVTFLGTHLCGHGTPGADSQLLHDVSPM